MELTLKDRILLVNQYRILKALEPANANDYDQTIEILERGYAFEYGSLSENFSEEFSDSDCNEVVSVLNMYRMMKNAYRKMDDKTGIDASDLEFRGFDGNEESRQHGYAEFLINTRGGWIELQREDLNTARPMRERYRHMLAEWIASTDTHHLTKADVLRILRAA
jgi:uncharacterized protein YfbU (UPF0304 family)